MGSKFPYGRCKQFQYSDVCPLLMDGGSGTVIRALAVFGYVGYRRVRIPGVDRSQVSLRRSTEPEQETAPGLPGLVDGDIESVEEWIIKVTMHEGLNIYDTEGTLLDLVRGHLAVFSNTDVEMTVVSPGYSSFLITHIVDEKNALSMATMPHIITSTLYFPVNSWFLYNFGTTTGRTWNISVRPCNYWVQQDDNDVISPSIVKYIDMGNEENYEIKLMPITKGMRILHIPPVGVIVGNPALLEVTTEGYFDITDSYHMKVHIASKFFQKGSTSLALVVWEASSQCYLTTLVPTMKSSCSYLRTMHHIPGRHIPPEHWISGVHKDSQGFNMIKTLPETGKYKQCANARDRAMCNCTEHQKFSHAVAFSDCKEKGSELFHFKVSVIPGVSFCDLHEEFQIYVDEVPLPFPGHVLIAVATSVVLGGLIFVAFLFQLRNIHPLRAFRRYVRGTIAHSSNLSIDS
ncbi:Cation channel sperm-associated protein subunit beta [Cricetulus griseus]|uniref:Cation channel sperm-associated protein subunit beta n=1 Tax=Cricetulus griseus TaxID=10029 RepID=G3IA18_CRIGR|nr:Cation channel sperm-associated protein subunit beta [Cricetulus griseus]